MSEQTGGLTRDESDALDEWAESSHRNTLQPDPQLYEAFAEDRKKFPYRTKRAQAFVEFYAKRRESLDPSTFPRCINEHCRKAMRPKRTTSDMYPGTVLAGARGVCSSCHTTIRRREKKRELTGAEA